MGNESSLSTPLAFTTDEEESETESVSEAEERDVTGNANVKTDIGETMNQIEDIGFGDDADNDINNMIADNSILMAEAMAVEKPVSQKEVKPTFNYGDIAQAKLMEQFNLAILAIRESVGPLLELVMLVSILMNKPPDFYCYLAGQEVEAMFSRQKSTSPTAFINRLAEVIMGKLSRQDPADPSIRNVILRKIMRLLSAYWAGKKPGKPVEIKKEAQRLDEYAALRQIFNQANEQGYNVGDPPAFNPSNSGSDANPTVLMQVVLKPQFEAHLKNAMNDIGIQFPDKWNLDDVLQNDTTRTALGNYLAERLKYEYYHGYRSKTMQQEYAFKMLKYMEVFGRENPRGSVVISRTAGPKAPTVQVPEEPRDLYGNGLKLWHLLVKETPATAQQYLPYIPEYARLHNISDGD